jgi:hypothetical protein
MRACVFCLKTERVVEIKPGAALCVPCTAAADAMRKSA